jgi:lysophospholipase L1-like esterase
MMLTSGAFGYLFDYILWWVLYLSLLLHTWCFFKLFPWKVYRKLGLSIGNGLVFLCLIGFVALAGESYFRFACVQTDSFGVSLPARRWFALHTHLNSLGCRDREWSPIKPPGIRRIAFVGDSFIYGWGIERTEDRFPDRIQSLFDGRSPGTVEVMNVAKPGWDTGAQLQPIQDMIARYGVDEVVLCYVANDIEKLLPTTDDFNPIRPPDAQFFNMDSSCLMDYLYRRIYLPRIPSVRNYHDWLAEGYGDEGIWRRHQEQLNAIIGHCRENGVTLHVALLPFIRTSGDKFHIADLHALMRRFFEVNQTPVVDLYPAIAGLPAEDLVVNRVDAHPNERAHKLFAEAIWRAFYAQP